MDSVKQSGLIFKVKLVLKKEKEKEKKNHKFREDQLKKIDSCHISVSLLTFLKLLIYLPLNSGYNYDPSTY